MKMVLLMQDTLLKKKRDRQTLHKIIQNEIEIGTEIHSDEWLAYKMIENKGYIHKTVNHSQFFVDTTSGAHNALKIYGEV